MNPDIIIFVSHRIDIASELIASPLYTHMRCGAVFDEENKTGLLGDDTGDNISHLRMNFCEFTVQYWAWKNCDANYYGLCHYRRYLSFAKKQFPTADYRMVFEANLLPMQKRKYGLENSANNAEYISHYDVIVSDAVPVGEIITPTGKKHSVREVWEAYDGVFFEKRVIDLMFQYIEALSPSYLQSAKEYFAGGYHLGFNCYVMRRELFEEMCTFQFPVMNAVYEALDMTNYTETMQRSPAYVGEMLYGIFIYHIRKKGQYRIKEQQLVFFRNTDRVVGKRDLLQRYFKNYVETYARKMIDPVFPLGSSRREGLKKIAFRVLKIKKRGIANTTNEKREG